MIPENGEISVHISPALAPPAPNAPTTDITSGSRIRCSGRGCGGDRRGWRTGSVVRGGSASGPATGEESSAVIGSRIAQRAGTGPGHDLRGDEVHQHGDREQREARREQRADREVAPGPGVLRGEGGGHPTGGALRGGRVGD